MSFNAETTVGQIATDHPLATRVFARHKIDYCCGGGSPLKNVCEKEGLNAEGLLEEIKKELETIDYDEKKWNKEPLSDLIDHILSTYHRPLDEELPRLEQMVRKVHDVHGDKDPEMFTELKNVYLGLKSELENHMMKEEQILFPMVKRGEGSMAGGPVNVMMLEHDNAGNALKRFRELTNDYNVPEEACNTWKALWHGLEAMEESLHQHIHLENNILFPRALKGE
jgi:regulator of cell morphogenesis and NO signaling